MGESHPHVLVPPGWVVVPGDQVQVRRPPVVVQRPEGTHEVRGHRGVAVVVADPVLLVGVVAQQGVGHEPAVVQGDALERGVVRSAPVLTECVRHLDLLPVGVPVRPEHRVPGLVQHVQALVALLQPQAEPGRAARAVAGSVRAAVLVTHVPGDQSRCSGITLGDPPGQLSREASEHRGARAVVVPLAVGVLAALEVGAVHLRIGLGQPRRHRAGGGGEHDVLLGGHCPVHDLVQEGEVVAILGRLQVRPGEDAQADRVQPRLLEGGVVLLPHLRRPLLRVVVAAVAHGAEAAGRLGGRFLGHGTPVLLFSGVVAVNSVRMRSSNGRS